MAEREFRQGELFPQGTLSREERDAKIVRLYLEGMTTFEVADVVGCCQATAWLTLRRLGVQARKCGTQPIEQMSADTLAACYERYLEGETIQDIAPSVGHTKSALFEQLRTAGYKVRRSGWHLLPSGPRKPRRRIHTLNEAAFDVPTPEACYWVGFLSADAGIGDDGSIALGLGIEDKGQLYAFRNFLGSSHKITEFISKGFGTENPACRFQVGSKRLAAALAGYGVVPRKTCREKVIGLEGSRDFWRGCIDGDGHIGLRAPKYHGSPHISLCGGPELMEQFRTFTKQVSPSWDGVSRWDRGTWVTCVCGIHAARLARSLYDGAEVYLPRKCDVAKVAMAFTLRRKEKRASSTFSVEYLVGLHDELGSWAKVARHLGMSSGNLSTLNRKVGVPAELMALHTRAGWVVTSPEGEETTVPFLPTFCEEYGLSPAHMGAVASGKRPHHQGWKCRKA